MAVHPMLQIHLSSIFWRRKDNFEEIYGVHKGKHKCRRSFLLFFISSMFEYSTLEKIKFYGEKIM